GPRPGRHDPRRGQCIPRDAIVDLREERAAMERDASAPGTAGLNAISEADLDIGPALALAVLKTDEESTGGRRVVAVIPAAPRVDVDHAVRRNDEVPGVADVVREHRRAESGGQRDPAVVVRTHLLHGCPL